MAALGKLVVSLSANVAEFTSAMDKAAYTSQKNMDSMVKSAKIAGAAIAGALTAGAGMLANEVKNFVNAAEEMGRLSKIAGASAEEFSKATYAVERHGMSAEKLADIYKDVQDKVGDFVQTGGGGMKDFFEQVAPKIGVTAEQFRKLSGPDALQLYFSSLEKANLSQSDLVFYMEAIASDATNLIPLLRDSGAGFKTLAQEAESLGVVLTSDVVQGSKEFNDNLTVMGKIKDGIIARIATGMLPMMQSLSRAMAESAKNTSMWNDIANILVGTLKVLASAASIIVATFQVAGNAIGATAKALWQVANGDFKAAWETLGNGGKNMTAAVQESMITLENIWGEAAAKSVVIAEREDGGIAAPIVQAAKRAKKSTDMIKGYMDEAVEYYKKMSDEGAKVYEATRTPLEKLNTEIARLNELLANGAIDWDTYGRAVMDAQDKYEEMGQKSQQTNNEMAEYAKQAARNIQDVFAEFLFDPFKGNLNDMLNNFGLMIRRMIAQAMAARILSSFGSWGNANSGAGGVTGAIASAAGEIFGGGRALGGDVKAGHTYLVGEKGPEMVTMGANGFVTPNQVTPNMSVNIINESGQPMNAKAQGGPQFDGEKWVLSIVMNAANTNQNFRNVMGVR